MHLLSITSKILATVAVASLVCLSGVEIPTLQGTCSIGIAEAAPGELDKTITVTMQPQNLPMKGNPDAIITIMEFSDYQCPFCSRAESTIDKILQEYPNDVRVSFCHKPLPFHTNAKPAAKAAHAAFLQNKFWEMHDLLFKNQKKLSDEFYFKAAEQIGLDIEKFKYDMNSEDTEDYIQKCIDDSNAANISGTPTFLINGTQLVGAQPFEAFKTAIDEQIERAKTTEKSRNLRGDALYQELIRTAPPKANRPTPSRNDELDPTERIYVASGNSPSKGDAKAPVTIIAFMDFQCPFSKKAFNTLEALIDNNPKTIRVVFKHLPLPFHNNANLASRAAIAANDQKKFWEYAHKLFANQDNLKRDDLIQYARELKLKEDKFITDIDDSTTEKILSSNEDKAHDIGIRGTPHFFINGLPLLGAQPLESFQAIIDNELKITESYKKKKLSGEELYELIVKDNPQKPPIEINIKGAPFIGSPNAPVTIIEFSDFQCPYCSRASRTMTELINLPEYKDKIKLVFKQLPLPFHKNAQHAAEAAIFAHEHGKFWEMHDKLFDNQNELDDDSLLNYAKEIGLDPKKLQNALENGKYKNTVTDDINESKKASISGTPSFIINGKLIVGAQPIDNFKKAIDEALKK